MHVAAKLGFGGVAWLVVALAVYFAPESLVSEPWKWALMGCLLLPLLLLLKALLEGVVELAFVGFVRAIFAVLTFGRVRPERNTEFVRFPWYRVARGTDGRWVVDEDLAGVLALAIGVGAAVAVYYLVT